MGDRLGIPGDVKLFSNLLLQPAEGTVAAASQEKHLRKSRKHSPSQQKKGYGNQHSSSLREASDPSNDFWYSKHYFIHVTWTCHSQNVIFGEKGDWAASLLTIHAGNSVWNLDVVSDGNYWKSEWFCACNMMTKLPPELLFPGHEIKIKSQVSKVTEQQ